MSLKSFNLPLECRMLLRAFTAFVVVTALLFASLVVPGSPPYEGGVAGGRSGSLLSIPAPPVSAPPEPFLVQGSKFKVQSLLAVGETGLAEKFTTVAAAVFASFAPSKNSTNSPSSANSENSLLSTLNSPHAAPPPAGSVTFDFDGDSKAEIGRWHSSTIEFKVKNSASGTYTTTTIGTATGKIAPADYDGDNKTDAAVFDSGTWTIKKSSDGQTLTVTGFGQAGDVPVSGNYTGTGAAELAVYRPSNGTWYYRQVGSTTVSTYQFGAATDVAVPGNYDGDGYMDFAVFRPLTGDWHIMGSSSGYSVVHWGLAIDTPVMGDFDGDGRTDPAVYRPTDGTWYAAKSSTGYTTWISQVWGNYGDQPAAADYDGDGKTDFCVWRPTTGVWHTIKSSTGAYDYQTLGVAGDVAVPSAYTKQVGGQVSESALATARLSPRNATSGTNLYSQNFGWGTSLVGLPGRAGLNAGFGMSYNSLVWTKDAVNNSVIFDTDKSNISPGFRFGFPVIEPTYFKSKALGFAYMMVTPDGGRVEFRQTAAGNTYETADSSYTQLVTNSNSNPNTPFEDVTITVKTTDGTQLSYQWKGGAYRCSKVLDRNGNNITINHDSQGLLRTVTDTLGRVITVNYDYQLYPTTITQTWKTGNGDGSNTTHTWATFSYTTTTINTSFNNVTVAGPLNGTMIKVLQKVTYPDNSFTQFDYNGYGQVWKVRNVAADSTSHVLNYVRTNLENPAANQTDCPRFTETRSWVENFNQNGQGTPQETVVTNSLTTGQTYSLPDGHSGTATKIEVSLAGHPNNAVSKTFVGESGWMEGLPIATEDWADGTSGNERKRWTWTNYTQDNTSLTYILNPRATESKVGDTTNIKRSTVEYLMQGGSSTVTQYGLASAVNVYETDQTTVLKRSETDYNLASAYISRRIIGLPSESRAYGYENGSLPLVSKMTYAYDEGDFSDTTLAQNISPVQHDNTNYGASFIAGRANGTSTTRYDVTGQTSNVTSNVKYNTAGAPVSQTSPGSTSGTSREVKIGYADSFNTTGNPATFAYPTTLTDPAGTSLGDPAHSSTVKYRYDIGANVWAKSPAPAGNTTGKETTREFDNLGRPIRQTLVNTGAYTRYEYPTNGVQSKVFSTIVDTNNNNTGDSADEVLSENWADGAGRVRQSRTEHPGSIGGYSGSLVEYDILGRVKRSTVPTEINSSWNPAGDDYRGMNGSNYVWLWNLQEYDWKGRTTRTIPSDSTGSDGKDTLIFYAGCGCAGGQVTTVQGPLVPRDDQPTVNARRTQKAYADILGRDYKAETLTWTGSVYSTVKTTFNGRDQATLVRQYDGADTSSTFQDTTATFDGHGRLKTKHIPQQDANAATTYNYNADDSISNVTDARGAVTNFTYDNRGLVTNIGWTVPSGSGITDPADVTYSYDNIGNRTAMTDGLGGVTYNYNALGQITSETRQFSDSLPQAPMSSNRFQIQYSYGLSGQLTSMTDPYGQQINYAQDKVGRLSGITGSYFGGVSSYLTNPQYRAWGAVKHLEYGDNAAHMDQSFDNRLQAASFNLVKPNAVGGANLIQKSYEYLPDGNLKKSVDQNSAYYDRAYSYDHADRMKTAVAGGATGNGLPNTGANSPYEETFHYDAFDNRPARRGLVWGFADLDSNYNGQTNQPITTYVNNRLGGTNYDADGRPTVAEFQTYSYDAAGEVIKISGQAYESEKSSDGDGNEIKRRRRSKVYDSNGGYTWRPWKAGYMVYSSVLGKTLSEAGNDGSKNLTFIYAFGEVFAKQAQTTGSDPQSTGWEQSDASGATVKTMSTGPYVTNTAIGPSVELEADGIGVSPDVSDPSVEYISITGFLFQNRVAEEGGCVSGGEPVSCVYAEALARYFDMISKSHKEIEPIDSPLPSTGPESPNASAYAQQFTGSNSFFWGASWGSSSSLSNADVIIPGGNLGTVQSLPADPWYVDASQPGGDPVEPHQLVDDNPCQKMVALLRNLVWDAVKVLGGSRKFAQLSHDELDVFSGLIDKNFSGFYLGHPADTIANIADLSSEVGRGGLPDRKAKGDYLGSGGFRPEFQDPNDGDQTHHFAMFFSLGINGYAFTSLGHDVTDLFSLEDLRLSHAAYPLGESFRRFHSAWTDETPAVRARRIMDINWNVRRTICSK